jgi:hypothetical protein
VNAATDAQLEDLGERAQQEVARLCQYVSIDMAQRLIRILKPIHFQGSKHAGGVNVYLDPDLANAICAEVATALQICNDLLQQQGLAPLGLTVEGHTSASMNGHEESVRISSLRAMQCERSVSSALKTANPGVATLWGKPVDKVVSFEGKGSTVRLPGFDDGGNYAENRRVEMRLVEPGDPAYFAGGTAVALQDVPVPSACEAKGRAGGKGAQKKRLPKQKSTPRIAGSHEPMRRKQRFKLENDPNKSINEQLREQIKQRNLRTKDLFFELDGDGDGLVSKADWRATMQSIAPDVPAALLEAAFVEADGDGDGTIEISELEGFLKGRKVVNPTHQKKVVAPKKPPSPVKARAKPAPPSRQATASSKSVPSPTSKQPSLTRRLSGSFSSKLFDKVAAPPQVLPASAGAASGPAHPQGYGDAVFEETTTCTPVLEL